MRKIAKKITYETTIKQINEIENDKTYTEPIEFSIGCAFVLNAIHEIHGATLHKIIAKICVDSNTIVTYALICAVKKHLLHLQKTKLVKYNTLNRKYSIVY